MKKIFMIMTLMLTILFLESVSAKEVDLNQHKQMQLNSISTLACANSSYIEDEFWGCLDPNDLVKCGNSNIPSQLPVITRSIVTLIKIAVPLVLIVMGMIDMLQATIASDEKKMADAKGKFIKRLIAGAVVFLVVTVVQFVVGIVAPDESPTLLNCVDCMISDGSKCTTP